MQKYAKFFNFTYYVKSFFVAVNKCYLNYYFGKLKKITSSLYLPK